MPALLLDEKEIKQLFLNLTRNAIDALSMQGKITIASKQQQNYIILSVTDNGHGMPPEICRQIFTPFFTTKPSGTGLGLSICASIVKRHERSINVESTEESGSCFTIALPINT